MEKKIHRQLSMTSSRREPTDVNGRFTVKQQDRYKIHAVRNKQKSLLRVTWYTEIIQLHIQYILKVALCNFES